MIPEKPDKIEVKAGHQIWADGEFYISVLAKGLANTEPLLSEIVRRYNAHKDLETLLGSANNDVKRLSEYCDKLEIQKKDLLAACIAAKQFVPESSKRWRILANAIQQAESK
jgi:hypothetical protein